MPQKQCDARVKGHVHLLALLCHILGFLGDTLGVARLKGLLQPGIAGISVASLACCQSQPSTLLVLACSRACLRSILLDCKRIWDRSELPHIP